MNTYNKKALIELLKSFGRFMWFGAAGLVALFLTSLGTDANLLALTWTVAGVELPVGVYIVAGIGFAVKAIDLYIHENKNIDSNGLAPKVLQS